MLRKALLLVAVSLPAAAAGCRSTVAPREETIGGTLGGGNARTPVPGIHGDAEQDTTRKIGGTLGGGQ